MRIIRCKDREGRILHAARREGCWFRIEGAIPGDFRVTEEPVEPATLLAPIDPAAILCIGMNYRRHAEETGGKAPDFPILFMKSPGAVAAPGQPILLPRHLRSDEVDYEAELAVVIGTDCKNVTAADAWRSVLGYTCANDVSARDWQLRRSGRQWCRAKSFDTFCPLGPELVTPESLPDPQSLAIRTRLNGDLLQDSNTADMIFTIPAIIEFLSGSMTLKAGTVILTGTPEGVGMARVPPVWLKAGDRIAVEIEGIGTLENPVEEEPSGKNSA